MNHSDTFKKGSAALLNKLLEGTLLVQQTNGLIEKNKAQRKRADTISALTNRSK
jgi:hypothetical protein